MQATRTRIEMDARELDRLRPAELLQALRRLNLRNRLGDRVLGNQDVLEGCNGYTPAQLIRALRQQIDRNTQHLKPFLRRKVRYFYQVQMCPQSLRAKMAPLIGLTYLPGGGRQVFPENTDFWDLDRLEVMTLATRLDRLSRNGEPIAQCEVKLHLVELDRQAGTIKIGGSELVDDQPVHRTVLSRIFSLAPGRSPEVVPSNRHDVVEAGLALHEVVEMAAVGGGMVQTVPVFPEVYLGFKALDDAQITEATPALKAAAYAGIMQWLRAGCPYPQPTADIPTWGKELQARLRQLDPNQLSSWADIAAALPAEELPYLLAWTVEKNVQTFDGHVLLPLSLLPASSVVGANRVFVSLKGMLGREPVGGRFEDGGLGRLQVVHLDGPAQAVAGLYAFDFLGAEPGLEEVIL